MAFGEFIWCTPVFSKPKVNQNNRACVAICLNSLHNINKHTKYMVCTIHNVESTNSWVKCARLKCGHLACVWVAMCVLGVVARAT